MRIDSSLVYLDASALAKLDLPEAGSDALGCALLGAPTSSLELASCPNDVSCGWAKSRSSPAPGGCPSAGYLRFQSD